MSTLARVALAQARKAPEGQRLALLDIFLRHSVQRAHERTQHRRCMLIMKDNVVLAQRLTKALDRRDALLNRRAA